MKAKREQAIVGLFVLVATGVLVATIFTISGFLGGSQKTYHASFPFAGGIEPGTAVRYAGGPKVGRVEQLRIDPNNPARIEVTLRVRSDLPVKTDSHARIMSSSPLGDNHIEILPGSPQAPIAEPGSLIPSDAYVDFSALAEKISQLAPEAQNLIRTLNDRAAELRVTVDRVNDVLSAQNRGNLTATLASTRGMIEENRPELRSTLQHVNRISQTLEPLVQDLKTTSAQANRTLNQIDAIVGENRADLHESVVGLRKSLTTVNELASRIDQTLDANSGNLDEVLDNLNHVTTNLKEFTETIKTRPNTLIRSSPPPEHRPGGP